MTLRVLPRVELGQPVLRAKARKLKQSEIKSSEIQLLIKRMFHTVKSTGGVGLAAPQVGYSIQLAVVNVGVQNTNHTKASLPPAQKERFVMINPVVVRSSKEHQSIHEGCLSFIDIFGEVSRPQSVDVLYYDELGEKQERTLTGLVATVFQHEYDHLQGVVWIDRATDSKTFMTKSEYKKKRLIEVALEVNDE